MTQFIFTELPSFRTLIKVDGADAVLNTPYDIALASTIQVMNQTLFRAEPMDYFKYKIIKNGVPSVNVGKVNINFAVNSTTPQSSVDITETMLAGEMFFFTSLVPYNVSFDRITIVSITGLGQWLLYGNPISAGQQIFSYQLPGLSFVANESGSSSEYSKLQFYFSTKDGNLAGAVSSITVAVTSLAKLILLNTPVQTEGTTRTIDFDFQINNALINKPFTISVDTTAFAFNGIGANIVSLSWGGSTAYDTAEAAIPITGFTGDSGIVNFSCTITTNVPYAPTTSQVVFTLTEIDGDSANVDSIINTFTVNIPTI